MSEVVHHHCSRCIGRGEIKVPARNGGMTMVRCPVCLGLGEYETNPAYKRPDIEEGFTAVHSTVDIKDVIALLPEKESS